MATRTVEISEELFVHCETKASSQGRSLQEVIETCLRSWLDAEPDPIPTVTHLHHKAYIVQPGDTLEGIAYEMYRDRGQSEAILRYNDLADPGVIYPGQLLYIPYIVDLPTSEVFVGRRFRFALDQTETRYYRFGSLYASASRWAGKPHPGVDFHHHNGAPVYAIGEGIVRVNKLDRTGYGHYLMMEHALVSGQTIYSLYAHLQHDGPAFVTPPVDVAIRGPNVVIGLEGDTGYAGVPHLHFEIKRTADLGLYPMLNTYNLRYYFYDPYTFIGNPENRYLPVGQAPPRLTEPPLPLTPPTRARW